MAAPEVIQIPKTSPRAADPSAPSFLTTLPPEIRNRVYELLLKRDHTVLLHDGHAYRQQQRHRLRQKHRGRDQATDPSDSDIEQHVKDDDFHHGFEDCIGLLLSCRQIYHEQRVFSTLSSIGSQYQLLSRAHIDADAVNGARYRQHDLLPLLKLIWAHPQAKCETIYVRSGRSLTPHPHVYDPVLSTGLLNNLLLALGTKDALNLKQYAKYSRLMSSIIIWESPGQGPSAGVIYDDSNHPRRFPGIKRRFDILSHGSKVQWEEFQHWNVLQLPHDILSTVNAYACASETGVVFDLDTKTVHGFHAGLRVVNEYLRSWVDWDATPVYNKIKVQMSTQEAVTNFGSFETLRQ